MAATLLDRLLGRAPATPEEDTAPAPRGPEPADSALRAALAEKLLHDWAQNRQQVLVPLALNLARFEPPGRALLLDAMAAALAACSGTEEGRPRLLAALRRIGGEAESEAAFARLGDPPDLLRLVARLQAEGLGAEAYAATALVLDRRQPADRAFLDWLAARLALPPSLTASLGRRYRG